MKKHFLTGLVLLLPLGLTAMIVIFLFDFFTTPFVGIVSSFLFKLESIFLFSIPKGMILFLARILTLLFLVLLIFLLGILARWFFLKKIFEFGHFLLLKIPIVKSIYHTAKDIFSALFSSDGKKAFKRPVILPFPFPPSYALGFEAGEVAKECQEKIATPLTSVFMPTSPHPISGFLFLAPKDKVHGIEMTNEEAIKFLVSCGMIHPGFTPSKEDEIF